MKALNAYISMIALLLGLNVFASSSFLDEAIKLKVEAGKAFAEDLTGYTNMQGKYAVLSGPSWLSVTEKGIVFGTPTYEELGMNKLYVSVEDGDQGEAFLVMIEVMESTPQYDLTYNATIGEVFVAKLGDELELNATYSYENLPSWLEANDEGVLVGMPEMDHYGEWVFNVRMAYAGEVSMYQVSIKVELEDDTSNPNVAKVKVGNVFSVNLYDLIGMTGLYSVWAPKFLNFYNDGTLIGSPSMSDVGTHRVHIRVRKLLQVYDFYFDLVVEK